MGLCFPDKLCLPCYLRNILLVCWRLTAKFVDVYLMVTIADSQFRDLLPFWDHTVLIFLGLDPVALVMTSSVSTPVPYIV